LLNEIEEVTKITNLKEAFGFEIKSGDKRIQHTTASESEQLSWITHINEAKNKKDTVETIEVEDWGVVVDKLKLLPNDDFNERKNYYEHLSTPTIEKLLNENQLGVLINDICKDLIDEWKNEKEDLLVAIKDKEIILVNEKHEEEKKNWK